MLDAGYRTDTKFGGPAGTVLMVYDEAGHLIGEYSGTGTLVQETVWLGDTPVATIRPSGSTVAVYYVHADHLNAPRLVTQPSTNKIAWRWDTDPYGTTAPNQNPAGLGTFVYNLRVPGQYYDSETGVNQNYFRDYDPQSGRYIESDPIGLGGGINTYAYVGGNPISNIDPLGLTQCDIDTARAIAAAADLQMSTGQPLLFPSSYGSASLGFSDPPKPRRITARTIPGFGTVLSDYYQQVLNNQ